LGASGVVTADVAYAAPESADIGFDSVASNLATADSDRNLSWLNALPGE